MAAIDNTTTGSAPNRGITREERKVIFASSLGTVFEWYDFYLYGSLAAIIAKHFFAGVNETTSFIFALLAFAAGFAVRPFGAIVFGRLGDMIGRKHTFLITIVIMGVSTAVVGFLPGYATIGVAAPIILITLRLLQGLALGGEYGGAATYVAEHAPKGKRGYFTSWIQTTATLGLFLSLLVILACRTALGNEAFEAWGWRIPFLLSILLLVISVYIRLQLSESPVFLKMKAEGKASKAPLTESFARWDNLKIVIMALLGGTAGQAVVWYTGQFYALFFLLQTLKIDAQTANLLIAGSLLIGTPFFVIFGSLSDRIGRKGIIMAGCILAALTYFPIFTALTQYGNPDVFAAQEKNPVTVIADPDQCSFQFDPVGKAKFTSSCDLAKTILAKRAIPYENVKAEPGTVAQVRVGEKVITSFEGTGMPAADFKAQNDAFTATLATTLKEAGYPEKADPAKTNYPMVLLLLTILVIYVTMVYGPIAAWLVELFPARIRYTSMSLPYHIGNGWFGGFLPTVAFAMVAATGDIYYGLWYPIVIAVMTAVLGIFFMPETKDREIHHT
ncbi:MFS transporter [Pseudomonas sp. SDO5532_S415]|jgi:MFS family permease|uniref:MFS transporter n=1 Tax=Pseudomonas sp. Irchel 3A7 TaxID=2008913 RepID=UPI000BA3AA9B|nr:MFS transporter [Pseudomonas sp. Irchel 3A7]